MKRANLHVKDATRRLYLSNRSGWGVTSQRATLRLMGIVWPVIGWVSFTLFQASRADLNSLDQSDQFLYLSVSDDDDNAMHMIW
jgi:hypothetical protein